MNTKIYLDEVDSTNKYLRELTDKNKHLEEGTLIWSKKQTKGRGQTGNNWESEENKNLTFSFVLYPVFIHINEQFILSELVATALLEELSLIASGFSIKWPNDIYWMDKKIAGILIENDLIGSQIDETIIGIGLNVNQTQFISNAPNPVSLKQITGENYNLEELLDSIMSNIFSKYLQLISDGPSDIHSCYMSHLYRKDGLHTYRDKHGIFEATIDHIEPDGHLILIDKEQKLRSYAFKEVEFIQINE
ncbi:MAG: biotin--[acetyl-CoA-carboxylase] ligase [Bacteroidales bacterium]